MLMNIPLFIRTRTIVNMIRDRGRQQSVLRPDFGQLRNVIYHSNQRVSVGVDRVEIVDTLVPPFLESSSRCVGEPDNGIHWISNLMAHICQEITFGLVGNLRLIPGSDQFGFVAFQLSDIIERTITPRCFPSFPSIGEQLTRKIR